MRIRIKYINNNESIRICKASMATAVCLTLYPRCLSALPLPLPSSTLSKKHAHRALFARNGSTREVPNKKLFVRCNALRDGSQGTGGTVYQGVYGPWSIDAADNREVILYRAGLVTSAVSFVLAASAAFLPDDFFIKPLLQQNLDTLYAVGVGGLGLSLVLIHIYVTPIKRTLQILWAVGMLGSLSTSLNLAQPAGEGLVQYVIENPVAVWFIGPVFAALTGLVFKEGLCYGKLEAAGLTFVIPTLLLGHLTGFMDDQLKLGLLGLWMVLFTVFAARKFTQPIKRWQQEEEEGKVAKEYGKIGNSVDGFNHDYGTGEFSCDEPIVGTSGRIGVWKPDVAPSDGYVSLAQVWLRAGSPVETMEAGWHVYPSKYNDPEPRFFTYWTSDGYRTTGCYNAECPGFVVLDYSLFDGQPLHPVSVYGTQTLYELPVVIRQSTTKDALVWYLTINGHAVGYWPASLFKALRHSASSVSYGGEVISERKNRGEALTKTDMGSGQLPGRSPRWPRVAGIRQIQLFGPTGGTVNRIRYSKYASRPACYDAVVDGRDHFGGLHVFYGGPGGDMPQCVCIKDVASGFP